MPLTLPPHVVSGELVTSAWGNGVVTVLEQTDKLIAGTTPGAAVAPGGQTTVASITLPAGAWLVLWQASINSTANMEFTARLFFGGSLYTDAAYRIPALAGTGGNIAQVAGHLLGIIDAPGGTVATVNIINSGAAAVTAFADPATHRFVAMGGRF